MNKKNTIALALALVMGVGLVGSVYAYQGDYTKTGPNYSPEKEAAMEAAFDSLDYNTWKELMKGHRVTEVINEDNFARFVEARNLARAGQVEEADSIRAELGLRTSNGEKIGAGRCYCQHQEFSQRQGRGNQGHKRQANFIDANGDGVCDNLNN